MDLLIFPKGGQDGFPIKFIRLYSPVGFCKQFGPFKGLHHVPCQPGIVLIPVKLPQVPLDTIGTVCFCVRFHNEQRAPLRLRE